VTAPVRVECYAGYAQREDAAPSTVVLLESEAFWRVEKGREGWTVVAAL
jgi:hypothetical protein